MKFDIIQIYCLSLCCSSLCLQEDSVIKAQLAFRHATERKCQASHENYYKQHHWSSLSPPLSFIRQHRNGKAAYLKYVRIFNAPTTSERMSWPLLLTRMLTLSTTSRNTYTARDHLLFGGQEIVVCQDSTHHYTFVCQCANKAHNHDLRILGSDHAANKWHVSHRLSQSTLWNLPHSSYTWCLPFAMRLHSWQPLEGGQLPPFCMHPFWWTR